ncbi:hypothetical protein KDH83_17995 [Achromobacter sp. Marseille-Q0513]|uniref:hypothetical protein n=1 Tax=Achromobacter sp. Marseille-Q0513 TaxID=2829161 RepID=UPI001B9CD7EE|nr:hypothetical protein [Achromobacter sp. Marseille-Q0513]MBR8655199.1 hypothetical protein [Achromobacter sp. Marseille-Q0513]
MYQPFVSVAFAVALSGVAGLAQAQTQALVLPTAPEATDAIAEMFSGSGIPKPSEVKLGTCIAALEASHAGQVACTVSVTLGAAINETQLDFYKQGKKWKTQPSASQDQLPFPDPKLHE